MSKNFAIKDCIDLDIYPYGSDEAIMRIDYLNNASFNISAESVYAKSKGANAIQFAGAKEGELSLSSELTKIEMLGMQLGGNVIGQTIKITDAVPSKFYKLIGVFKTVDETGAETNRRIIFHKCSPKVDAEVTFDSENVAEFNLSFDLMVDSNKEFITIDLGVDNLYNNSPVISGVKDVTILQGATSIDLISYVTANDVEDGDLTSSIVVNQAVDLNVPGEYYVKYSVTDSAGEESIATCKVTVLAKLVANNSPVISLISGTDIQLVQNATGIDFLDYVTANDVEDGDVTANIVVDATGVDLTTVGTYTVIYSVTDSAGDTTVKTVDVVVS